MLAALAASLPPSLSVSLLVVPPPPHISVLLYRLSAATETTRPLLMRTAVVIYLSWHVVLNFLFKIFVNRDDVQITTNININSYK